MISHRFRILAAPSAIALLLKRGAWIRSASATNASPTPWSDFPAGFAYAEIANSLSMDLSKASTLVIFRLTYQPGTTWNFNVPYPIVVAIESGSLNLHGGADPVVISRPVSVPGKAGTPTHGTSYTKTTAPGILSAGKSFSSQTGNIGVTSNDGDVPVQLIMAGAVVQPPLTEETTSSTPGTPQATREP